MNAEISLPPIPQPPHDPTSWLLAAHTGWRAALLEDIEQRLTDGALALTEQPASARSLTEASGSLGGLVPPANVALGPDGSIFLLDPVAAQLKLFDPCLCEFVNVPCFGGVGADTRQLQQPYGIAICNGNLFVCDAGNRRVTVLALRGFTLRGHWRLPASTPLAKGWEPYGVACDGHGRLYVTDRANGSVRRFSPTGIWEMFYTGHTGLTAPTHIAIDCEDRVYLIGAEEERSVRVLDAAGQLLGVETSVEKLQSRFPELPFEVDAAGRLRLGAWCEANGSCPPSEPQCGVFDLQGNRLPNAPAPPAPLFQTGGRYISRALDSDLHQCQWHRVILRGDLPGGASLTVSTYSAEALLSDDQIQALPAEAWETRQTANALVSGAWDCLIRSGAGRYLWLKLELHSNGRATPRLTSVELEFPRISLRRYLPAVFGLEPASADFTDRFLSLFDTTLRGIEDKLDHLAGYFDPRSAPAERDPRTGADFLTWLSSWVGLSLDRHWPEARRRRFLKDAGRLYAWRGTHAGLRQQLLLLLDMEPAQRCCEDDQPRTTCEIAPANCAPPQPDPCAWEPPLLILEHYQLRRWLWLGAGRLGEQAALWGRSIVNRSQLGTNAQTEVTQLITKQDPLRDPFHLFAHKFSVFVPACIERSETARKALENLLRTEKPAQTQAQIVYVAPRFRIGVQSMIGFDTVIGRYPAGVTLDQTPLGEGSILTAPPHAQGRPGIELGKGSRIGATTALD